MLDSFSTKGRKLKRAIAKCTIYLMLAAVVLGVGSDTAYAKNASGAAAFDNLTWEKILEKTVTRKNGVVQAICATEDYIICMENSGDTSTETDIVYAYYKNDVDAEGNAVKQYSLAFKNDKWDWEHCNGMCYNAAKDEIYVALYTNNNPESRGCVYVMDPHTLDFKRSIKIADNYNILGIGYYPEKGRYIIQANSEGDYGIKILDGDFNKIADFGAGDLGLGSNSQDMCVCGDYIMNFPLTFDQEGVGSYMNVYSVDTGREDDPDDYQMKIELLKQVKMDLETNGNKKVEPESICEVEDGVFIVTVNIMNDSGKRKYAWYRTELGGYSYDITTRCENGTISASGESLRDGSYEVKYKPNEGYQLTSILVDGIAVDPNEYPASYTFSNITSDHSIFVQYTPKEAVISGQSGDSGNNTPVLTESKKLSTKWKVLFVAIPVLLAILLGIRRYKQHLRIERRKKYLKKKIRREKERQAIHRSMKEKDLPEDTSIEGLLQEIHELESSANKRSERKSNNRSSKNGYENKKGNKRIRKE